MIFKENKVLINQELQVQALEDIFSTMEGDSPLVFNDIKNFHVQDFTIQRVSKYRAREKSIDIDFTRNTKKNAEMTANVRMRFVGRLDLPYEVNIKITVEYTNKFTLDCYIKNLMWTYAYSMLARTKDLYRLYPKGMKIPTELYVDDKIQPALKLISNYK